MKRLLLLPVLFLLLTGAGKGAAEVTDASFDAQFDAARPRLERAAAEDAEYEKANGEPVLDPMPVI